MKGFPLRTKPAPNLLPYILLAGIIIGIAVSRNMVSILLSRTRLIPTETSTYQPTPVITSTTQAFQSVQITPSVKIQTTAQLGSPAPDFALKTIEGKEIKLSDLRGKAVLMNMWATWCPPCREEMPAIQAAYKKYKEKGLVVLGIDFTVQDNLADVKPFVQELKLTFPILLDETGEVSAGLYGMRALPTSYFINVQGVVRRIQIGAMPPEKIEEYLAEILVK